MIESTYFSPPCCLCDHKDGPIICHEILDYAKDHADELHAHCSDHKDTEQMCEQEVSKECSNTCSQPCNKGSHYLNKKKLMLSSGSYKFNLFGGFGY